MAATPDALRYLTKARESLASAGADFEAARYNSCANRSYYAAFQAAVAALIEFGWIARGGTWEHRYVIAEFSGKLVRQRKILPARFLGVLDRLLEVRITADYRLASASHKEADRARRSAADLISECGKLIEPEG